jgi:hypothetical protein
MLTVKHHTAEFMLQHGVSAERIGSLAPLRLRRRNMGTLSGPSKVGGINPFRPLRITLVITTRRCGCQCVPMLWSV